MTLHKRLTALLALALAVTLGLTTLPGAAQAEAKADPRGDFDAAKSEYDQAKADSASKRAARDQAVAHHESTKTRASATAAQVDVATVRLNAAETALYNSQSAIQGEEIKYHACRKDPDASGLGDPNPHLWPRECKKNAGSDWKRNKELEGLYTHRETVVKPEKDAARAGYAAAIDANNAAQAALLSAGIDRTEKESAYAQATVREQAAKDRFVSAKAALDSTSKGKVAKLKKKLKKAKAAGNKAKVKRLKAKLKKYRDA